MIGLEGVLAVSALSSAGALLAAMLLLRRQRGAAGGPRWVSFAVGVLLGAVLLDLLPHLWEETGSAAAVLGLFAGAMLLSWLLDTACVCRHAPFVHAEPRVNHDHDHDNATRQQRHHHGGPSPGRRRGTGALVAGDLVHSLVDGSLICAALMVGAVPGAVATMAVMIHEVPRRVAIVALLRHDGWRTRHVLALCLAASAATLAGATLAWWAAGALHALLPAAIAMSAAAMLYAALAQSGRLDGSWRARVLTLEFALPFIAGMLAIGGSHHLRELLG